MFFPGKKKFPLKKITKPLKKNPLSKKSQNPSKKNSLSKSLKKISSQKNHKTPLSVTVSQNPSLQITPKISLGFSF